MNSQETVIDLLKEDHRRMRDLYENLQHVCEQESPDLAACISQFGELMTLVKAHSKAEEYTLYSRFSDTDDKKWEKLRHHALEGFEQHELVERILNEMAEESEINDKWDARLSVLIELLDNHLDEEELEFFPLVQAELTNDELTDLGEIYLREREEIQQKEYNTPPRYESQTFGKAPKDSSSPSPSHPR